MMKKLYTLSLLVASCVSFAQITEPFTGAAGTALNAAGWMTHSGTTPGQMVIAAGSVDYTGITSSGNKTQIVAGNSEDVNLALPAAITGTAYYSAIINVLNTDGLAPNSDTAGNYFLMFGATAGSNVTIFNGRLYVRAGVAPGTFNLGILNGSGGTATPTFASTDYPINTSTFVVVKYDFAANAADLFINPTVGGTEGTALVSNNTGTNAGPAQIASVAIRQAGNATLGTGNIEIDNIRAADNWAYVTSGTLAVKQNGITGLSVFPNPVVNGTFTIQTDNSDLKNVAIYDVLGKQVFKTTSSGVVNVSNLNSGVYVLKITEAGKTATRKLVIQ